MAVWLPASSSIRFDSAILAPGSGSARYVAELHEIAARYAEWEITGPAEIREVSTEARYSTPHRAPQLISNLGPMLTIVEWRKPGRRVMVEGVAT